MKKILIINTVPMIFDGIGMVILNYVENMKKDNIEVDFLFINEINETMKNRISKISSNVYVLKNRSKNPILYSFQLMKLIKKNKYHVIHAHGNSATLFFEMFAGFCGGCKLRVAHSHNTKSSHPVLHKLLSPIFKLFNNKKIACGQEAGEWLYGNSKFLILNNAIDSDKYRFSDDIRNEFINKYNLKNKVLIGCVAHFTPHKNHRFLIDVFERIKSENSDYVLCLAGEGRLKKEIQEYVRQKNINDSVIFFGLVENIPEFLSAMDIMVLTSFYEGLPNVAIEWQSNGVPIFMSSRITKECDITNSIKFLDLNIDQWVNNILEHEISIDKRMEISNKNIEIIKNKNYDINIQANKLLDYYWVNKK